MGRLDALGLGSAPVATWAEALSRPNEGLDGPFRMAAALAYVSKALSNIEA